LRLSYLVLDFNGTLATDGKVIQGVKTRLKKLEKMIEIHIITADTFGNVKKQLKDISCKLNILTPKNQDLQKMNYIKELGNQHCVCIGNGRNDHQMLQVAELGIAVILEEGTSSQTINSADLLSKDINSALDLLSNPLRLIATLRT
jgi:soluble P-type ATPase